MSLVPAARVRAVAVAVPVAEGTVVVLVTVGDPWAAAGLCSPM
jgi:hypothetical protein